MNFITKRMSNKNRKGFTLVELIVVIAIIAILAAVIGPNIFQTIEKGKISAATSDFKAIKTGVLSYYSDTGMWPADSAAKEGFVTTPTAAVEGWDGPYIEAWPTKNPWGGVYTFKNIVSGATNPFGATNQCYFEVTQVPAKASAKLISDLGADVVKISSTEPTTMYILIATK